MEINTNLSTTGVNGAVASKRSAPSPNMLSDRVSLDRPLMFHQRIYNAIRERNPKNARIAMQEHITDARDLMR